MVKNLRSNVTLRREAERANSRRMRRMTPISNTTTENTERVSRFRPIPTRDASSRTSRFRPIPTQDASSRTSRFRPISTQENTEVTSNQTLNMSQMPITREMLENADRVVYIRRTHTPENYVEEVYSVEQDWKYDE